MLNAIRAWWLRSRLEWILQVVENREWRFGLAADVVYGLEGFDTIWYRAKHDLRSRFPSASLIEIADGHVTVVQDGVTARVSV